MICLFAVLLIDTSLVKIYDLIYKQFISKQIRVIAFAIISSTCLLLQFLIIYHLRNLFTKYKLGRSGLNVSFFNIMTLISLSALAITFGILIIQINYLGYYSNSISISIILLSYGTSSVFLLFLAGLFFSWYRSNRDLVSFLYFLSMALISVNLLVTAVYTSLNLSDRPSEIRIYIGGSIDISYGRYSTLSILYSIFSGAAFLCLWIATGTLMKNYAKNLIGSIAYWSLLSLPLVYFLVDYSYQFIIMNLLAGYPTTNPVTVSIILTAFLSLSKPIGGLTFGVVFWRISKTVGYERKIQTCMIISGWGILLTFACNQAVSQSLGPFPPFGLATSTALILGTYLMLFGIYNSARLVAVNTDLRKSIYRHAVNSRLLGLIGQAEMDIELQRTVGKILQDKDVIEADIRTNLELDGEELKKYLDLVIREVKQVDDS